MQELELHDMWFQQDGATCHTARVLMDLLRGEFGEHYISRSEPVNQTSSFQLTHWKTILKHLFVGGHPKYWKEYAKIGLSGCTI